MCIDACPTGAMAEDGALKPTRCVLYGNFRPGEFKDTAITDLIGMRVHGCDACQVACASPLALHEQRRAPDAQLRLRAISGLSRIVTA